MITNQQGFDRSAHIDNHNRFILPRYILQLPRHIKTITPSIFVNSYLWMNPMIERTTGPGWDPVNIEQLGLNLPVNPECKNNSQQELDHSTHIDNRLHFVRPFSPVPSHETMQRNYTIPEHMCQFLNSYDTSTVYPQPFTHSQLFHPLITIISLVSCLHRWSTVSWSPTKSTTHSKRICPITLTKVLLLIRKACLI